MSCHDPIVMRKVKDTWTYVGKLSKCSSVVAGTDPADLIMVPCGRCPACAKSWRDQLAQRAVAEYNKYGYNKTFLMNLTVNDDYIDEVFPNGSLDHKYFQKFMKRLRINLQRKFGFIGKIKYLMCGEYGGKNHRPHFHVIVYGWKPTDLYYWSKSRKGYNQYRSDFVESCWKAGFVTIGDVSEHTAPYLAKYVAKFKDVKKVDFEIDGQELRKPYIVYPRDMLGWEYFLDNMSDILRTGYLVMSNGKYCAIPKSWIKKLRYRCEMSIADIREQELYGYYLDNLDRFFSEQDKILETLGYDTKEKKFQFKKDEAQRSKEKYLKFRFDNTGKEMI